MRCSDHGASGLQQRCVGVGGNYDPVKNVLSPGWVTLGAARHPNMQVTIGHVISGPTGTFANGGLYSYDTASNQMTMPSVSVGNTAYYNVVATVGNLVSAEQASGTDNYDGATLAIPYVQVGDTGSVYGNVNIALGGIVRVDGGMPKIPRDIDDPATGLLSIGAVQFGGVIYTNVVVSVSEIKSVGTANPGPTLGPGTLTTRCRDPYCLAVSALLVNTAATPLHSSSIVAKSPLDQGGGHVFAQTNDCPATVGPGQSCSIFVYRLTDAAPYQGTLTVADDGTGSPRDCDCAGAVNGACR